MAEIHSLRGVFNPYVEKPAGPDICLKGASETPLRDIAIVGRGIDGEIHVWGSPVGSDAVIGLLMRGANWLAERTEVAAPMSEDDGA